MNRRTGGGPRTKAGKIRSSYNALRHGLAATHRRLVPADGVERLAQAICGDEDDAALLGASRAVAENAFVLSAIRQQRIVVIERLKEATAIALRKGDNSLDLAKARFMQAWLAYREIQTLLPQVMKKYEPVMLPPRGNDFNNCAWASDDIVPIRIKALLEEEEPSDEAEQRVLELARKEIRRQQRNEYEALEEAVPDLVRLERYERRAWSRQQRAIQEFVLLKFSRAMAARFAQNDQCLSEALTAGTI
jgi:hypothetical protein